MITLKKDKLLALCKILINKGIDIKSLLDEIKELTDADIDIILKSVYPHLMILLLTDETFKSKNNYIKRRIVNSIDDAKDNQIAEDILGIVKSKELCNHNDLFQICKLISNSASDIQAYCLCKAVRNKNVLQSYNMVELLMAINHSYDNSVYAITDIITSKL